MGRGKGNALAVALLATRSASGGPGIGAWAANAAAIVGALPVSGTIVVPAAWDASAGRGRGKLASVGPNIDPSAALAPPM